MGKNRRSDSARARSQKPRKEAWRQAAPMRVNIRNKVWPHGRDALSRDPAWHVHKREQTPYPLYTRERPWESRKRASRRATPDRAGVRPYHDTNESILTRNKSLPVSPLLELFLDRSVRRITVIFGTSHVSEPQSEPMRARPPATCTGFSRVKVQ
jgi:hypothetical protein